VYFTQLMGLAFGMDSKTLGLTQCIVPATAMVAQFA
jgi:heterodisulfide reductase subunit B